MGFVPKVAKFAASPLLATAGSSAFGLAGKLIKGKKKDKADQSLLNQSAQSEEKPRSLLDRRL